MKKFISLYAMLLTVLGNLSAQENNVTEILTKENKLTAVNVVLLLILSGILIYLVIQDKKIKKLEDRIND